MKISLPRRSSLVAIALIVAFSNLFAIEPAENQPPEGGSFKGEATGDGKLSQHGHRKENDLFGLRLDLRNAQPHGEVQKIEAGNPEDAAHYYARIAQELGLPAPPANLDQLLTYFGYDSTRIDSVKLAESPAKALMKLAANEMPKWEILAAGYFSPKTSDVSGRSNKTSWRKAVRLKARPGSPAQAAGLDSMFVLTVVYLDRNDARNPFDSSGNRGAKPVNVQVLLVRDPGTIHDVKGDPAYFLAFDPANNYARVDHTATTWDAADPQLLNGEQKYYLPTACIQCHGGSDGEMTSATLNFFDTDYFIGKAAVGEDFEQTVGTRPYAPLYNAGKDPTTEKHFQAFQVFRQLNEEAAAHNQAVDPASLQSLAAENWLRLHEGKSWYFPPIARGLTNGGLEWNEANEIDRHLEPLLVRYCYRCHSTFYFNVLDRQALIQPGMSGAPRVLDALDYLDADFMPPDRTLSKRTKTTLITLLKQFAKAEQIPLPGNE